MFGDDGVFELVDSTLELRRAMWDPCLEPSCMLS